jgi:hypothetical protein
MDSKRLIDPCGQYKEHLIENIIQACGILPTHIDENNPVKLIDQACLACNTTKELHIVRDTTLQIDDMGVVHGIGGDVFYPLAVIARQDAGGKLEAVYIHNGGQMIFRDDFEEAPVYYSMVVNN